MARHEIPDHPSLEDGTARKLAERLVGLADEWDKLDAAKDVLSRERLKVYKGLRKRNVPASVIAKIFGVTKSAVEQALR